LKTFYCTGFYPLLFALCSNELLSIEKVCYVRYTEDNWRLPNLENEEYLVEFFCKYFKIRYSITDIITHKTKPFFKISEGDYISENLISFLSKDINKTKVVCVAEGASGLKHLFFDKNWIRGELLNNRHLSYLLFDDFDSCTSKCRKYNVKVVDFDIIISHLRTVAIKLSAKLNFDFSEVKQLFCPFLLQDLKSQKDFLLNKYNYSDKIYIKKHPSDFRDFSIFKDDDRFLFLPESLDLVPAELFFVNGNTYYWGYYGTLIMTIRKDRINIINCNSEESNFYIKNQAKYLFKLFEKRFLLN
jgi:hypothetical protein